MVYDIHSQPRKPLANSFESLTELNSNFGLAKQIYQCREPDFLLELIESQGSAGSLKWLSDVLETDGEYSVNALPISSLCELYISGLDEQRTYSRELSAKVVKKRKFADKFARRQRTITERLHSIIFLPADQYETSFAVLSYFISRLIPPKQTLTSDRQLTLSALSCIFESQTDKSRKLSWLVSGIPTMPSFQTLKPDIVQLILNCCRYEFQYEFFVDSLTFIDRNLPENLCDFILPLFEGLERMAL